MGRPIADINADILKISNAKAKLIEGKTVTSVTIGEADFRRTFAFAEMTVETLNKELAALYSELATVEASSNNNSPKFRNSVVQHTYKRGY